MSYVPGNATGDLGLIAATVVATIGGASLWQRWDHAKPGTLVAHCADGTVIGLWKEGMRRRWGRSRAERARARHRYPRLPWRLRGGVEDDLAPGQLRFARARPGSGEEAPWVVEGLDRQGDSLAIAWEFEDEAEARGALGWLAERIVRPPLGPDGLPLAPTDADFEAAAERARAASDEGASAKP